MTLADDLRFLRGDLPIRKPILFIERLPVILRHKVPVAFRQVLCIQDAAVEAAVLYPEEPVFAGILRDWSKYPYLCIIQRAHGVGRFD
ncbi:hypothetical protein D3C87_1711700 [compost metagenome]